MHDDYLANQLIRFRNEAGELLTIVNAIIGKKATPDTLQRQRLKLFRRMISHLTPAVPVESRFPYENLLKSTMLLLKNTALDKPFTPGLLNPFAEQLSSVLDSISIFLAPSDTIPADAIKYSLSQNPAEVSPDIDFVQEISFLRKENTALKHDLKEVKALLQTVKTQKEELIKQLHEERYETEVIQEKLSRENITIQQQFAARVHHLENERARLIEENKREVNNGIPMPVPAAERVLPSPLSPAIATTVNPPPTDKATAVTPKPSVPPSAPLDSEERLRRIMASASGHRRGSPFSSGEPGFTDKDKE